MKWRKGTFRIETKAGDVVSGLVSEDGLWGIDKPLPGSCRPGAYVLNHVPSGWAVAHCRNLRIAKKLAEQLAALPGVCWNKKEPMTGFSWWDEQSPLVQGRKLIYAAGGAP